MNHFTRMYYKLFIILIDEITDEMKDREGEEIIGEEQKFKKNRNQCHLQSVVNKIHIGKDK